MREFWQQFHNKQFNPLNCTATVRDYCFDLQSNHGTLT